MSSLKDENPLFEIQYDSQKEYVDDLSEEEEILRKLEIYNIEETLSPEGSELHPIEHLINDIRNEIEKEDNFLHQNKNSRGCKSDKNKLESFVESRLKHHGLKKIEDHPYEHIKVKGKTKKTNGKRVD